MTPAAQTLLAARELLSEKSRWHRGSYAGDAHGNPVPLKSPDACRWCALGAIEVVSGGIFDGAARALYSAFNGGSFVQWHDGKATHEQVLKLFSRAIALELGK